MPWLLALVIGLASGVASGLFGIGGGVIIVPAVIFGMNLTAQQAIATSLMALLMPVGLLGVMKFYQAGHINSITMKYAALIALGLFIGAYFGASFAVQFKSATLNKMFAVFLVLVAIRIWTSAK